MLLEFVEQDNLKISIEVIVVEDKLTETIDVNSEFSKIKQDVTGIINSFGYTELEDVKKSDSGSLYFTFCDEEDFNKEEVTLVIRMRVSDHTLPLWDDDKTEQDAKNRQKQNLQNYANSHKVLNKNYGNKDNFPVDFIYVKYENEFYNDLEDVYKKIRQKLAQFRNKHKKENYLGDGFMKLIIKEEKYDLSWKEHDVKIRVDGEMGTYPSYAKRVGNLVVNIDPEVFDNGEFGYTVYYTPHIGRSGFKKAESGFMNSSEAMDYADTYIFGASDFVDPFWESKSRKRSRRTKRTVLESPTTTVYSDVETFTIPYVYEKDADKIINFANKTNYVEDCLWDSIDGDLGQIKVTTDSFTFRMILIWVYRKGFTSGNMRIGDILRDNGINENYRTNKLKRRLHEQDIEIEVKHEGILEVPEGKNVDDLPVSHFVNLAKKKGLSKITKALNNLQVWNKKKNPSLSKWAGNMIDKVSKKMEKNEAFDRYNSNIETDFMEPGNLYNDMPDTENTQDDVFEFYVSYCMNNCRNENTVREYLESENLPDAFIDSIIDEIYRRFDISESFSNGRTIRESAAEKDLYDDLYSYADQYRMTSRWTKANVEKYLERQKNFRRMSDADFQKVVDKVNKDFKRKKKVKSFPYDSNSYKTESIRRKRLKEDSLDDFVKPNIEKRYIWPLYDDSAYEISEIIEKYQNTNRFKNEIKSFDLKDIEYMDWPALQLELVCSTEAYVLIRKDIEREGLYMDDDEFDESYPRYKKSYRKYGRRNNL